MPTDRNLGANTPPRDIERIRASTISAGTPPVATGYIDLDTGFAGTASVEGRISWNSTDGTAQIGLPGGNVVMQIGQEIMVPRRVKNNTGSDMYNGQLVYISGGDGNNAYVALAKADAEATSAYTIAMLTEDIDTPHYGYATTYGLVRGDATQPINTSAYAPGTVLYLSATTAGGWTSTKPDAPNHLVSIGTVYRQHATEGAILVSIQNGYELSELHDVYINPATLANGDLLQYVAASTRWERTTTAAAGIITGSIAVNQVAFGSGVGAIQGSANLTFDGTTLTLTGPAIIKTGADAAIGLIARAHSATQSANLMEWQASTAGVLSYVTPKGYFVINGATATATTDVLLALTANYAPTAAGTYQSVTLQNTFSPTAGTNYVANGASFTLLKGGSQGLVSGTTILTGGQFAFTSSTAASGGIFKARAGYFQLSHQQSTPGTLTNGSGIEIFARALTSANTITNLKNVNILATTVANSATITNLYGLYIENMNVGGTLNYSMYTNLGNVRIGDDIFQDAADSDAHFWGAGRDMSAYYDGTNGYIRTDLVAASDLHFSCGADKTFVLDESVYVDIDFPILIRTTGANIPTLTTLNGNITMPQWQVNDYNVCESQEFVHQWKEASSVNWHLHLTTNGLDATNRYVRFELEYGWVIPGGAWTFPATLDSGDLLIPANTADKTMLILSLGNFTPAGGKIGGHAVARLRRIAATGTAPSNNPWIPMLQMHVECDTLGSRLISSK